MVHKERLYFYKEATLKVQGPVVYWMSRDQRTNDNWALLYAVEQANSLNLPVYVVFTLAPSFPGANLRHYSFLLNGLIELRKDLSDKGIGFELLLGKPEETLPEYLTNIGASLLISDFDPLRVKKYWKEQVMQSLKIPHIEVDAHNIVPCRFVSQKVEFGAYTLRPKITKLLPRFLTSIPALPEVSSTVVSKEIDWPVLMKWLNTDESVRPVEWIKPGPAEALNALSDFLGSRLEGYSLKRNNPLVNGQSNLSPYIHFGHLSAQRVALEVTKADAPQEDKSAFLEELIVRRELSDNFCLYNPDYDNVNGFHQWASSTLNNHKDDEREFIYALNEFENALTHDPLWNAAQLEMVKTGKMHGYMRMYWAKKILEWTKSPEQAMELAIYLNDKYSLDGRDPNGYTGIAWSIGGVHDRAWSERPIFGKIRYMNYNGCKRKFDVNSYISAVSKIG